MPIGDISKTHQLWIVNPDGTKIMLGDVQTVNTIVDPYHSYDEVTRAGIDLDNWLRLHGYRAKRRKGSK